MMADNVEVTQSTEPGFFGKLGQSILCAVCGAPLMILGATILLASNEKTAVCQSRAIDAGEAAVKEVGCTKGKDPVGNDQLVMFTCPLKDAGLELGPHWINYDTAAGIMPLKYVGTGLSIKVEMLQCEERSKSETEDGKTVTTYHYRQDWSESPVDSMSFAKTDSQEFRSNCGKHNPDWPLHMPRSTTLYAPSAKIGEFELSENFVQKVPLTKPVELVHFAPGWGPKGPGVFQTDQYAQGVSSTYAQQTIGTMRVTLTGTDWSSPTFTVLGHEAYGKVKTWAAPPAWLCSGYSLESMRAGHWDMPSMFGALQDEADSMLYLLRIVGFGVLWCAFAAIAGPLGVLADCIPFVGPYIGDAVDSVTCCISCMPASACCFAVAASMWVVMRPMVGIPLFLVSAGFWGGLIYAKTQRKKAGGEESVALKEGE